MTTATAAPPLTIALIGNPNSGKSTLFNRLTGLRQRVGNYPGVTVERRVGRFALASGRDATIVDLPGVRSLAPRSPDERIAVDVLLGRRADVAAPDVVVVVLNALHLEVSLYLLQQVRELGVPVLACANVADEAERKGIRIDYESLSGAMGVPVLRTVATRGEGFDELMRHLEAPRKRFPPTPLPEPVHSACERLRREWPGNPGDVEIADALIEGPDADGIPASLAARISEESDKIGPDLRDLIVGSRHRRIAAVCALAVKRETREARGSIRLMDRVFTNPVSGTAIFLAVMLLIFWGMFSASAIPMNAIESGIESLKHWTAVRLPQGMFTDLLADGVIAGVGAVVVFLPQIILLFLFLGILEDSGYLSRAVLLLDKPLSLVGLSGRGFVPLLGSMACAVPGVMATRVIPDARERLATILVAPLMTCSARLPVYTVLIGTVIVGSAATQAFVLLGLYMLGLASALAVALVLRRTTLRSRRTDFVVELPPYRWPSLRTTGMQLWQRTKMFLKRAGTVILGISILLWFLTNFPKSPEPAHQLERSVAGRAGKLVEPAIRPLGYDWKIGIGLLTSFFSAREVFVSSMSTIYSVDAGEGDPEASLARRLREERDPGTGGPRWTRPVGLSLMVFYVFAMLCSSTVVTVARESASWRWALVQVGFMSALAYVAAFVTYRVAGGG